MIPEPSKLRPGVRQTIYPTTPLLLGQKTYQRFNVLVGDDPAQVRFAEQVLGVACYFVEILHDEDILGKEGSWLYRVEAPRAIELSPNTKAMVGIWSLEPIEKGSAGAYALVKYAASLVDSPSDKNLVQRAADKLLEEQISDVRASLWQAAWILTGPLPPDSGHWSDPWAKTFGWLPEGVDPGYRLNSLYRYLRGYIYAQEGDSEAARKFGLSVSKFKVMKNLTLDLEKVDHSIRELSRWRTQKYNPLVCALKISYIWNAQ